MDRLFLRNVLLFVAVLALAPVGGFTAERPDDAGRSHPGGVETTMRQYRFEVAEGGYGLALEGTGGVSLFGLVFSHAAGAKPIITSSQDEKLEKAKALGAFATVNYRSNPEWQREVRELTGGHGVDQVLDVGGRETLGKALEALAYGGHIALIGGLSGYGSDIPTDSLMWINATASGVYVGSRADFEAMNEFISQHRIRPHIDRVFEFKDAREAYDSMGESRFMGKIVIRIP